MIGLVFFAKSPRNIVPEEAGRLARLARSLGTVQIVALAVNPDDALLETIMRDVGPDIIQLHGSESPERVAEIGRRYGIATMKAVGVRDASDLDAIDRYREIATRILIDAKPPKDADRPGGNGEAFDWTLLEHLDLDDRFMLSGGLDPASVASALKATGLSGVDVSSGVERAPGIKDEKLIAEFVAAAKAGPVGSDGTGRAA